MTTTQLNAGDQVDSRCLKCKDVTNHVIIALVEEKIAKVQCNVCGGRHNFRPALPVKESKSGPVKRAAVKGKTVMAVRKAADNFTKILKGQDVGEATPYAMTAVFGKDDLVDHPTFGVGIVTAIIPPNKVELTFNEGPRILICQLETPPHLVPGAGSKAKRKKKVVRDIGSDEVIESQESCGEGTL